MISNYSKLYLITLIVLSLLSCTSSKTDADVFGKWEGNYNDHKVSFIFKSDKTCILKFFDKELNNFVTINGNYELDFSKKPLALSISNISELNHSLYTIVEFNGNDLIRIAEFSPKWRLRPISFNSEKSINLKRALSIKKGEKNDTNI